MAVDGHLREPAEVREPGKPDHVDARHDAGAAGGDDQVVVRLEQVDVVRDVERVHRHAAGPVGVTPEHRHDGVDAGGEGRVRTVALQLVVFDEVDAGRDELGHDLGQIGGAQPDARLHDRAQHRPGRPADEFPGPREAEPRSAVAVREGFRQLEVEQLDRGELGDLEQVPRHRSLQVRDRRPEIVEREAQAQRGASALRRIAHGARQG